jgi:multiple sugar transport system substrate-binding protein
MTEGATMPASMWKSTVRLWRMRAAIQLLAMILVAAACTAGGGDTATPPPPASGGSHAPVTVTLWTYWTGDEKKLFDQGLRAFEDAYPWITVNHVGGITDPSKVLAAVNGGNPPDLWQYWDPTSVQPYCSSGAILDLKQYADRDGLDMSQFSPYWISQLQYQGRLCALPYLADAYGLYYNESLMQKAGFSGPPETLSELVAMAKKLTQYNPDGSIKVAGFVPLFGWHENGAATFGQAYGATWLDDSGNSALASDPRWADMFRWQKSFVDSYGYDKLQTFVSGSAEEFSASNDFQIGRVAMTLDGEWRVAFIAREHPELKYGTAPFPVADDHPELAGSGYVVTNVFTVPSGADHPYEAWLLAKFLSTDTNSLVNLGNALKNIPDTQQALTDPTMTSDPHFKTFLDIYQNPDSSFPPTTSAGAAWQGLVDQFAERWQAGKVSDSDLESELEATAEQIDRQLAQGAGG